MHKYLVTLFLFLSYHGFNQVEPNKYTHDFGDLYENATSYYDFVFTNKTDKKQFLLTIDKPREISYIYSGKILMPDSSITVRLKIDDSQKGKFNNSIDLYFSDSNEPVTLKLTGNIKEVARNPLTECPDFNNNPPNQQGYEFAITVKVIDSLTREPIKRAKVYFVQNNTLVGTFYTNKDGIIHREFPLGYYFITAEKDPYLSNYKEGYLNFQQNYVEIELQQTENNLEEEIIVAIEEEEIEEEIVVLQEEIIEEEAIVVLEEEPQKELIKELDPTPLEELADSIFDELHFKQNNITFILDVSSSMNATNKLDLLKLSMIELVKVLRQDDVVSIIKYSSMVNIVLENKNGTDSTEIIEAVQSLRTSSATAGGDAIEVAYDVNNSIYAPDKNNIVIMITDGAFNKGSKTYMETITENYTEKGIIFSVVGIKTSQYLTDYMGGIVAEGGGDFIEIRSIEDAQTKLLKEIKRTSFRGR